MTAAVPTAPAFPYPLAMLRDHWQGHRRLTRRVIEAFPEDALFSYTIGGMRPFSDMALELASMASGGIRGIATRRWPDVSELPHHARNGAPTTRQALLELWDATTQEVDTHWATLPAERLNEIDKAFGQWEGVVHGLLAYLIDNEIHHRGQGYVYLRSLGVEPPPFWDRT
jgi:uncharacterized damage-inducible protein DinB